MPVPARVHMRHKDVGRKQDDVHQLAGFAGAGSVAGMMLLSFFVPTRELHVPLSCDQQHQQVLGVSTGTRACCNDSVYGCYVRRCVRCVLSQSQHIGWSLFQELQSPRVVKLIAASQTKDSVYVCMELLGLSDLANMLSSSEVRQSSGVGAAYPPLSVLLTWAAQIAEGLVYMHSRCIVFCDLKSANVLLAGHCAPGESFLSRWQDVSMKLADFGTTGVHQTEQSVLQVCVTLFLVCHTRIMLTVCSAHVGSCEGITMLARVYTTHLCS